MQESTEGKHRNLLKANTGYAVMQVNVQTCLSAFFLLWCAAEAYSCVFAALGCRLDADYGAQKYLATLRTLLLHGFVLDSLTKHLAKINPKNFTPAGQMPDPKNPPKISQKFRPKFFKPYPEEPVDPLCGASLQ